MLQENKKLNEKIKIVGLSFASMPIIYDGVVMVLHDLLLFKKSIAKDILNENL